MNKQFRKSFRGRMQARSSQLGFTLAELLICIAGVGVLAIIGVTLYVVGHFIAKYW